MIYFCIVYLSIGSAVAYYCTKGGERLDYSTLESLPRYRAYISVVLATLTFIVAWLPFTMHYLYRTSTHKGEK